MLGFPQYPAAFADRILGLAAPISRRISFVRNIRVNASGAPVLAPRSSAEALVDMHQ